MIRFIMITPESAAVVVDYLDIEIATATVDEDCVSDVLDMYFDGDAAMIEGVMEKLTIDAEQNMAYSDDPDMIIRIQYQEDEGGIR